MRNLMVKELKALSRERLLGRYGIVVGAQLLCGLIVGLLAFVFLCVLTAGIIGSAALQHPSSAAFGESAGAFLSLFPAGAAIVCALFLFGIVVFGYLLMLGETKLWLHICRKERYGIADLFYGFRRGSHPLRYLGVSVLLLLVLLGLYLVLFILAELFAGMGSLGFSFAVVLWASIFFYVVFGLSFAPMIVIDRPETGVFDALGHSWALMKGRRISYLWMNLSFLFWNIPVYLSCGLAGLWVGPYISFTTIYFYLDAMGELTEDAAAADAKWEMRDAEPEASRPEAEKAPETEAEGTPQPETGKTAETGAEGTPQREPEKSPETGAEGTPQPETAGASQNEAVAAEPAENEQKTDTEKGEGNEVPLL